ncbi:transposase [Komagataeibacter xylinus NBRC 13693]|uniref:Transposase n=1 Tax=Komagataeibacter xylinus NBRC 13693 TaxID=1234668 RepID=A0A0D6QBN0_KOMXY|nr:transposase [Komagataeibacter xylinus NBRC 13693]
MIRNGLQWQDAPEGFGSHRTLYNHFTRWRERGIFAKRFTTLAAQAGVPACLMIDSTHLKASLTVASLRKKGR